MIDLRPAADRMAALVQGVTDDQLGSPTPCPAYSLGDLLDHISGLTLAFTWAAAKTRPTDASAVDPSGDASRLGDDWRRRIPAALDDLVAAWHDPAAWTGTTEAGGIELPADVAGLVTLDELVVHGWDIARASGQAATWDTLTLETLLDFLTPPDDAADSDDSPFGPPVPVPADAPLLDRVIALTGRDPTWRSHS